MEEEDDDDIYAPDESGLAEPAVNGNAPMQQFADSNGQNVAQAGQEADGAGSEDLDEDESDSDIDIITEKQEAPKKDATARPLVSNTAPTASTTTAEPTAVQQREAVAAKQQIPVKAQSGRPGSSYPPYKSSNVDVDAKPVYEPAGKVITEVDMDADFGEDDKPWRRPGTDVTDFFNYGFDEFTWANYCLKQDNVRKEAGDAKKQLDEMQSFLNSSGGMPGMPGMPGPPIPPPPVMPGMNENMNTNGGMPPEMQQMLGQMMAQGMDPSQMDPATFMQMMSGGGNMVPQQPPQQQQQQQQQGQQMGQGYGNQGMGYGFGSANQGGRGRGRRW